MYMFNFDESMLKHNSFRTSLSIHLRNLKNEMKVKRIVNSFPRVVTYSAIACPNKIILQKKVVLAQNA